MPDERLGALFRRFLRFGLLAWGGPVAQIAMLRRSLVDDERWISSDRFNRTLAVYQVLPGPEAQELCIFFGMLARGRIGGLLAGLAFMLPGFVLMLGLAWFYVEVGIDSPAFAAAFVGCQAAVLAVVVRGVHRIGTRALHDTWLVVIAGVAVLASVTGLHFAIPLVAGGLAYVLASRGWRWATLVLVGLIAATAGYRVSAREPTETNGSSHTDTDETASLTQDASGPDLLATGIQAGALTFGGAYTAIPFSRTMRYAIAAG